MKTVRRIELYLMEDIETAPGTKEQVFVLHNLSTDQAIELITELLKSLNIVLTPDEMKDLLADLEKALAVLRASPGTEPEYRGRLRIHEAL